MMRKLFIVIVMLFGISTVNATEYDVSFASGDKEDNFIYTGILEANDGVILLGITKNCNEVTCAYNVPYKGGYSDAMAVKYNKNGSVAWVFSFATSGEDKLTNIVQIDDGFIIIGYSYSSDLSEYGLTANGSSDLILIRIDNNGNIVWINNFGGSGFEEAFNLRKTSDGFVVNGQTGSDLRSLGMTSIGGQFSAKFDYSGNLILLEDYNVSVHGDLYKASGIQLIQNWGNATTAELIKSDSAGNIEWSFEFGKDGYTIFKSAVKVSDGYLIYADSNSSLSDYGFPEIGSGDVTALIIKIDNNGNYLWSKYFLNNGFGIPMGHVITDILEVSDGYLITTYANKDMTEYGITLKSDQDALIIKLDFNGNVSWMKNYHQDEFSTYVYLKVNKVDNNYVLVGYSKGWFGIFTLDFINENGDLIKSESFAFEDCIAEIFFDDVLNVLYINYSNGKLSLILTPEIVDGSMPGLYTLKWNLKETTTPIPIENLEDYETPIISEEMINPPTGSQLMSFILQSGIVLFIFSIMIAVKKFRVDVEQAEL